MAESSYFQAASGLWLPSELTASTTDVSDFRNPANWLQDWAAGARLTPGLQGYAGPDAPMALSTYYAALRNISEDIAKLPFLVYRRLSKGKNRAPEHPVYPLLHDAPNEDMTAQTFREVLMHHGLAWGNGYAEIVFNGRGQVQALFPIHPSRVLVRRDPETGLLVYDVLGHDLLTAVGLPGQGVRLRQEQVFHLKGFSGDGYTGYSVFRLAAISLGLSLAAQQYGAAFFANGSRPSGILTHPEKLSDVALKHLRESWSTQYSGPEQAGKPAILEEGMTWHPLSIPPEEAQYLQTRQFQVIEMARWFRMPPHKLADLVNAHHTNIEEQNIEYVTDTLMPWCTRWEQESSRKLFAGEQDVFAEHLVSGLLRGNITARAQYYQTRFGLGTLSPNDIRELESENPIGPQGDKYFLAANNYQPLDQLEQPQPPQQGVPFRPQQPRATNGHAVLVED